MDPPKIFSLRAMDVDLETPGRGHHPYTPTNAEPESETGHLKLQICFVASHDGRSIRHQKGPPGFADFGQALWLQNILGCRASSTKLVVEVRKL